MSNAERLAVMAELFTIATNLTLIGTRLTELLENTLWDECQTA